MSACTVQRCPAESAQPTAESGWTVDSGGRLFCPDHPADSSCRICGRDKGEYRVICSDCAALD